LQRDVRKEHLEGGERKVCKGRWIHGNCCTNNNIVSPPINFGWNNSSLIGNLTIR